MATRTYCDHCGVTLRSPNRFVFGPQPAQVMRVADEKLKYAIEAALSGEAADQLLKQAMGNIAGVGAAPTKNTGLPPMKTIDLCDRCVPIWYERVDKLCKESDPKEGE